MTSSAVVLRMCRVDFLSVLILSTGVIGARAHEGHDLGINVRVPLVLSTEARAGKARYDAKCAACHGKNAEGSHVGPSLIPYDQAHHPDGDFAKAIQSGSPEHHWKFGEMPPVKDLTEKEIRDVITYVRELQAFNAEGNVDGSSQN